MADYTLSAQQDRYAHLLVRTGLNLQPGQSLRIGAEVAHRDFVQRVVAAAYQAGARYVHVDWQEPLTAKARYLHSAPENLEYLPDYEIARHRQMVEEGWPRLSLVGNEFPDIFDDVDPTRMRQVAAARSRHLKFYMQAVMANRMQWCVAAVPTPAWAARIFPDQPADQAMERLWTTIFRTCRLDHEDPVAAWRQHDQQLKQVVTFLAARQVQALHFVDSTPGPDGKPRTDLTVGLTDRPQWLAASAVTPSGVTFFPNMPTEELFTTPHNGRTHGWVRTSKPTFPFDREVANAYFRFAEGEVVEFHAETGQDVLAQFFQIPGTRRLGEVALVDVRSPVSQADVLFYEILFDENAACHIAFGEAYPGGVQGGDGLAPEELEALGVNKADAHLDVMIGTPTMRVEGLCADGSRVTIMDAGQFVPEILGKAQG